MSVSISTSKTYQELLNDKAIDSEWLEINDEVKLSDTAILVINNDKIDYFAYSMESAEKRVSHLSEIASAKRGKQSVYNGII
jgi:hypothetical protein